MKKIILITIIVLSEASPVFSDEYEDAMNLLLKEEEGGIIFLSKINLGIPGVVSWIANRDKYTYIYNIDDLNNVTFLAMTDIAEKSEMKIWDPDTHSDVDLEFDVFENISGTPLGSKAAMIDDYNGDGKDEVFSLNPFNDSVIIWGYNDETNEMYLLFAYRYTILDRKGPPPVEFVNYRGIDGIKVHLLGYEQRYEWIFAAWDKGSRKYVIVEEMGEDTDYSKFTPEKEENNIQLTDGNDNVLTSSGQLDLEKNCGKLPILLIGGGVLLVIGILIFLSNRKNQH
ncbi:MAG: hypothetical protein LBV17_11565 [Treponema sp.]|jgi:hypothetical protein|nr:hypothetical protein [Treponema sp.]